MVEWRRDWKSGFGEGLFGHDLGCCLSECGDDQVVRAHALSQKSKTIVCCLRAQQMDEHKVGAPHTRRLRLCGPTSLHQDPGSLAPSTVIIKSSLKTPSIHSHRKTRHVIAPSLTPPVLVTHTSQDARLREPPRQPQNAFRFANAVGPLGNRPALLLQELCRRLHRPGHTPPDAVLL